MKCITCVLRDDDGNRLDVVHRDVSPQNILVSYDGVVKVVDFGIARAKGNTHVSSVGTVKGKYSYMAPEQAQRRGVDRRADVFALGVILYEITTHRRLFKADSEPEVVGMVLNAPIAAPRTFIDGYPAELERIVLRALERDPTRRIQSAEELHHALERFIARSGEPVVASELGQLMREHFAASIHRKGRLLAKALDASRGRAHEDERVDAPAANGRVLWAPNTAVARPRRGAHLHSDLVRHRGSGPLVVDRSQRLERADESVQILDETLPTMEELSLTVMRGELARMRRQERRHRRQLMLVILVTSLSLVLAAATMIYYIALVPKTAAETAPTRAGHVGVALPALVLLTTIARPQIATITVDGSCYGNDVAPERSRGGEALAVRIAAPAYRPQELTVWPDRTKQLDPKQASLSYGSVVLGLAGAEGDRLG